MLSCFSKSTRNTFSGEDSVPRTALLYASSAEHIQCSKQCAPAHRSKKLCPTRFSQQRKKRNTHVKRPDSCSEGRGAATALFARAQRFARAQLNSRLLKAEAQTSFCMLPCKNVKNHFIKLTKSDDSIYITTVGFSLQIATPPPLELRSSLPRESGGRGEVVTYSQR